MQIKYWNVVFLHAKNLLRSMINNENSTIESFKKILRTRRVADAGIITFY